tara:strand:- start:311 stop:745 length:435 start_codon:yes stop_codon:yes gene_type:complete
LPNAQLLSSGHFEIEETYFAGSHVVDGPSAAQETSEIMAIIRTVITNYGVDVHDLEIAPIGIAGTVNELVVTWSVDLTASATSNWSGLSSYVNSFAFTTALTSAATTAGSTQHMSSFFEEAGAVTVVNLGVRNVPSPPPAAGGP